MKFLLAFLFALPAVAETTDENWKISLGAAYVNQITKRGLIVYGAEQFLPVISMNLGSPQFFISGATLNYKMTPMEDLILRARLGYNSTYDSPLYKSYEDIEARSRRATTTESELFWEYRIIPNLEFNGGLSQDLVAHGGNFARVGFRYVFGTYFEGLVEPAIHWTQGFGSKNHNEYLYGLGANAGSAFESMGFSIACPKKVDAFYPILEITQSWLKRENIGNGAFVRPNEIGNFQFLIWGAVRVW